MSRPLWRDLERPESQRHRTFLTPQDTGRINRARLIETLYQRGASTRAALARHGGTTRATIGAIVQPLLDAHVLIELDPVPAGASGGKPARPLWFSPRAPLLGAVHLLPYRVEIALVAVDGSIVRQRQLPLPGDRASGRAVIGRIETELRELAHEGLSDLLGIGIAVGGTVDTERGAVLEMALRPEFNDLEIGPALERELEVPCLVDLHPRAQALGDKWFGAGREFGSFASLYIGEAIGAGFVFDGRIHAGRDGAGGEIGHSVVDADGLQCVCGRRGCWETVATLRWLRARAAELGLAEAGALDVREVQQRADGGDPLAEALLGEYLDNLVVGLANVQQVLAPEAIILHGDVAQLSEASLKELGEKLDRAIDSRRPAPALLAFDDESHATVLGAAALVLTAALDLPV